ncbi:hypothetical protein E2C01_018628 [Portunus trituberculatus]|uniref:Uncharacterized protein n=1 Tax=Portunus trituberculatus TaxID=210409 RepID=A0A5B7DUY5_PORTR|nr:hypothetical protein [Portunus trituberculatus]
MFGCWYRVRHAGAPEARPLSLNDNASLSVSSEHEWRMPAIRNGFALSSRCIQSICSPQCSLLAEYIIGRHRHPHVKKAKPKK